MTTFDAYVEGSKKERKLAKDYINAVLRTALKKLASDYINAVLRTALKKLASVYKNALLRTALKIYLPRIKYRQ